MQYWKLYSMQYLFHVVTVPIDSVTKLSYALIKEPSFEPGMIVTDHRVR